MTFKVGDRVVLVNIDDGEGGFWSNNESDIIGNRGIVTEVEESFPDDDDDQGFVVDWDNNSSNTYHGFNLRREDMENV